MPPGDIYGLLGKNGAGKTTLLKLLTGLRFPQKGSLNIDGFEPKYRESGYLQKIFYIPEEFYLPKYSREKYEEIYAPFYDDFQHDKFSEYLQQFKISESCRLDSLSLGQKKKFILAFAFATNCQYLFLDEPTNGLDIPSKKRFRKLVAELIKEKQTILISTHQVHDISNLLDRVIILEDGKIVINEELEKIEKCLTMNIYQDEKSITNSIYSQNIIGGMVSLEKNETKQSDIIDLELLFNAVLHNSEAVINAIKTEVVK
jgi:ABC-2 type transport system ATP-binding protein